MNRGFCFRLDPSAAQARQMMSSAGVCRLIYNLALEQRRAFHRQFRQSTGRSISYVTQARELTGSAPSARRRSSRRSAIWRHP